jgi:7,8-dihydroneopterin aldolase/epimerase/oxygenase
MTREPGGWLCVEGIDVECTIGVTERERATKQRIVINLKLNVDFGKVAVSDAIRDSIDYRAVAKRVIAECEKSSFHLVETLAAHLSRMIFSEFAEIEKVVMEVWKPGALSSAKNVGAMIVASRDSR